MVFGIIPNIQKDKINDVIKLLIMKLKKYNFKFVLCKNVMNIKDKLTEEIKHAEFLEIDQLCKVSDIIVSIGGDGTMLSTAFKVLKFGKPILGLNFGKLGFLAEYDVSGIDVFLEDLKNGNYKIEDRIVLEGDILNREPTKFYAINDLVIDKGGWPKMIKIALKVNDDYVTTFSADGLILSTPTGSTGYLLSTGGPVVSPKTDVISLCPIAPHSLTMRPLVLASSHKIYVTVNSNHNIVQINCDGDRVYSYAPPIEVCIYKSDYTIKLIRTDSINYFKTLREKLFWGIDAREYKQND
jgi:NAD+ kinase